MPFVFARVLGRVMVSLPIAVAFVDCVAYVAKVEGVSMQPILNPNSNSKANDYVLLNKWKVRRFNVQRGDIVALKSPRDPDQKLIKRVIGLEGDLVKTLSYKKHYVQVPKGHCWVEGDHHVSSMDSNFFGPIALGLVFAKATLIVWPPSRWQKLESEFSSTRITINDAYDSVNFSTQEARDESPLV